MISLCNMKLTGIDTQKTGSFNDYLLTEPVPASKIKRIKQIFECQRLN